MRIRFGLVGPENKDVLSNKDKPFIDIILFNLWVETNHIRTSFFYGPLILDSRFPEGHGIADEMVIRDIQPVPHFRDQVIDRPFDQAIPDGSNIQRLYEQLKI